MRYHIDASPDCNVALGICKECNARFLSVSRAGAISRLSDHRVLAHPSLQFTAK